MGTERKSDSKLSLLPNFWDNSLGDSLYPKSLAAIILGENGYPVHFYINGPALDEQGQRMMGYGTIIASNKGRDMLDKIKNTSEFDFLTKAYAGNTQVDQQSLESFTAWSEEEKLLAQAYAYYKQMVFHQEEIERKKDRPFWETLDSRKIVHHNPFYIEQMLKAAGKGDSFNEEETIRLLVEKIISAVANSN